MMHQLDVPVSKTLQFVVSALPPSAARTFRILEVGCGTGSLAARLAETGYQVLALDSSPKAVRIARAKGVDAHVVTWPNVASIEGDGEYLMPCCSLEAFITSTLWTERWNKPAGY
jgi:2-polyprenyl-3-methyl-5-hydroxy-6-metoxy-1,4-benzoquinol methylase